MRKDSSTPHTGRWSGLKHVHYPYHPDAGSYGWAEGWVNFNTAFFTGSLAPATKPVSASYGYGYFATEAVFE